MKTKSLLLTALALLLAVTGVQAKTEKKSFDFSNANKEWNADHLTIDAATKTITYDNGTDAANAAVSWLGGTATDISGYDRLVLELAEPSTADIEVCISLGGFWGQYSSSVLAAGSTRLSLNLADLKVTNAAETDTYKKGDKVDLTKVNMIYLRTGWTSKQIIKVKDFYLAKDIKGYDQVLDKSTVNLLDLSGIKKFYNYGKEGSDSYSDLTWTMNDVNMCFGLGNLNIKVSGYSRVNFKFRYVSFKGTDGNDHAIPWYVRCCLDNGNDKQRYTQTAGSSVGNDIYVSIDLSNGLMSNDGDQSRVNLSELSRIYFFVMGTGKMQLEEISLESDQHPTYYLMRENATAGKYGTICLPFAASKPANADVYEVVGVDSKDAPTKLYINDAASLVAGKAYVFKSTDDQDVTFTKTGSDDNLTSPLATTSGLVGSFTAATAVPAGSYILSNGNWLKAGTDNTVNAYRAYLTLDDALVVPATVSAKVMTFALGGTTGIQNVSQAQQTAVNGKIYNLSGREVSKGYKGLVISNGKKIIVKH